MSIRVAAIIALACGVIIRNDANAETLTPGAPEVLDASGLLIGTLIAPGVAARIVNNNTYITFPISFDGFNANQQNNIYYKSHNCSGAPYLQVFEMPPRASVVPLKPGPNGTSSSAELYFPTKPYLVMSVHSFTQFSAGAGCHGITSSTARFGLRDSVRLHFTLPFDVK